MERKEDYEQFQKEITARSIEYLIHFTPTINLISIFDQEKLMSRVLLEEFDIEQTDILDFIEFPDAIRFDDKNYINLSISSPNFYLFNRFRERTENMPHINWCVLKVNSKYIFKKDTLFAVTNAASTIAKRQYGVSGDFEKFRKLFENNLVLKFGAASRGSLKAKYPTDVQAEVLVRNEIPLSDVLQICFKDQYDLAVGKASLSDYDTRKFVVDASMFTNTRL
jgi:hypothetical protein